MPKKIEYTLQVENGADISRQTSFTEGNQRDIEVNVQTNNVIIEDKRYIGGGGGGVTPELMAIINSKFDQVVEDDGYLVFYGNGVELYRIEGGGGGSASIVTASVTSGTLSPVVAEGDDCILGFTWSSTVRGEVTGPGTVTAAVNGVVRITRAQEQGAFSLDVTDLISVGTTTIVVTITDMYGTSRAFTFSVLCEQIVLTSDFNDRNQVFPGDIVYNYTPSSSRPKVIHFELDGVELPTVETTSSREQILTIPAQSHGAHTFRVWFVADVGGTPVTSNVLEYILICTQTGATAPIVALYLFETTLQQYYTYAIPFRVWTPNSTAQVTLSDGDSSTTRTVDRSEQIWSYRPTVAGSVTLSAICGAVTASRTVSVTETEIDVHEVTTSLQLKLSSEGRSKGDPLEWAYGDYSCSFSGFVGGTADGWQTDSDGMTVMRLKDNARISIPYRPFAGNIRTTGFTFEVEFSTSDVADYATSVISCLSGGKGIDITAQDMFLRWGAGSGDAIRSQYKEGEHMRVSFVVTRQNTSDSKGNLVFVYLNGIMSGAICYESADFQQTSPVGFSLGSSDCTTDIYIIRAYNRALSRFEILENWMADMRDGEELARQYTRNSVFSNDEIVPSLLPSDLPYLVISGTLPTQKSDSLSISGYYRDPSDGSKDFDFADANIKVQGTSSLQYPRKNYKIKFPTVHSINGGPSTRTFTFKADFASSEGANNVELVRLYDTIVRREIFTTPPQEEDDAIRQGIDGFPIVIFHLQGNVLTFLGKYNWNYDKGTEEVYGFSEGDESWETLNNPGQWAQFHTADYSTDAWQDDFEGRYPDKSTDATNLSALAAWLVQTDRTVDGLTDAQKEARLQKFHDEIETYMDLDDTIFYYIFTEMFLMIDSRVKNSFPTRWAEQGVWSWLPYDMDTALGINNEGQLVFDYNLEDIDGVFNGPDAVIWNNLRDAFPDEIKAMYQNLRGNYPEFSYDYVQAVFEEHQSHWPAAVWNEDAYFKYILPWLESGQPYLPDCQGAKSEQRKWWLYNRFRYLDSKYNTGLAANSRISFRSYALGTFEITPYADIYATVQLGSYWNRARAMRNVATTLTFSGFTPQNTETYIFSAEQLRSIGDISGFNPDFVDISAAIRLQSLKVGDASKVNGELDRLTSLTLGNNTLLRSIDARNCINLAGEVNASRCTSLTHAYFDGTAISMLNLPVDGVLETLHLPGTVTQLYIRGHQGLSDFSMPSYANIAKLWIDNPSDGLMDVLGDILEGMVADGAVRLTGFVLDASTSDDVEDFIGVFNGKLGLDEEGVIQTQSKASLVGVINVPSIGESLLAQIEEDYPEVTVNYTTAIPDVTFRDEDGSFLARVAFTPGSSVVYPYDTPTKPSTAQYRYTFSQWVDVNGDPVDLTSLQASTTVYASYTEILRYYTVNFLNNTSGSVVQLQTVQVAYGQAAVYTGTTPTYDGPDAQAWGAFLGWTPDPSTVTGNMNCYATFEAAPLTRQFLLGLFQTLNDSTLTVIGRGAFSDNDDLTTVNLPSVTRVGHYAFEACASLESVTLSNNLTEIGWSAFEDCTALTEFTIPSSVTTIYGKFLTGCTALETVTIEATTPPSWDLYNPDGGSYTTVASSIDTTSLNKIYIPAGTLSAYQNDSNWSAFSSYFEEVS